MSELKYNAHDQILTKTCEICGAVFITEYGYAIGAVWHVTGHHSVTAFMCGAAPGSQHWGCTPEHAIQALQACLAHDDHMSIAQLRKRQQEEEAKGRPRVAPYFQAMADRDGPDFHILSKP